MHGQHQEMNAIGRRMAALACAELNVVGLFATHDEQHIASETASGSLTAMDSEAAKSVQTLSRAC